MSKSYDQIILDHYDKQAREYELDPSSTMLDLTVRQRETQLVERFVTLVVSYLRRKGRADSTIAICDVGCGNGFTLKVLKDKLPDMQFHGFEFTQSLLELAQTRFREAANVRLERGDIRSIKGYDEQFDIVTCQRVLINLLDASDQHAGLKALARLLRPGGFHLSIEAFDGPLANLNAARAEFDLPPLEPPYHNRYLASEFYSVEATLVPVTGRMFDPTLPADFLPSNFLSSHFFVSRVLHPVALGPDRQFVRNSHLVRFLTEALERPIGDYSPIKAHAFTKVG